MSADRVMGLIRRVLRTRIDTSTPGVQADIESLAGEPHRDVEVVEGYGLTVCPPDDVQEAVGVFVGGESDHGLVLGWLDRVHRVKGLETGEVALYSIHGQRIKFDKLGQVLITSGSGSTVQMLANGDIVFTPSSQRTKIVGDLEVTKGITAVDGILSDGDIHSDGDVTGGLISLRHHKTTLVQPGLGLSGDPV